MNIANSITQISITGNDIDFRTIIIIANIIAIIIGDFEFDALIYGIAYLLVGYKVILKALKNIGRGEIFDENFLQKSLAKSSVF